MKCLPHAHDKLCADLQPPPYLHLSIVPPEKMRLPSKGGVERYSVASLPYPALSPMSFVMRQSDTESSSFAQAVSLGAAAMAMPSNSTRRVRSGVDELWRRRSLPPLPEDSKTKNAPPYADKPVLMIPITPFLTRALNPRTRAANKAAGSSEIASSGPDRVSLD